MTNTEIIQAIRNEIERQIKDPQEHCYGVSSVNKLRELLSFLDTLEESEKPMNPDEFKKEIEKTWLEYECYNEDYDKVAEMSWNEFENVARHFYELGKQSISPEIHNELEEAANKHGDSHNAINYSRSVAVDSFIAGAKWDRSQMMKEAVEGRVISNDGISFPVSNEIHRLKLMEGDKVRIIVCKNED